MRENMDKEIDAYQAAAAAAVATSENPVVPMENMQTQPVEQMGLESAMPGTVNEMGEMIAN